MQSTQAGTHETSQAVVERLLSIGCWEWEPTTDEITWSDQLFRIFGYEPGEVEPSLDLMVARTHPADREALEKLIAGGAEAPHARTYVSRISRRDGETRTVLTIVDAVTSDREGTTALVGAVQDVTGHRVLEQELAAYRATSLALAEWHTVKNPLVALLGAVGSALQCSVGAVFVPNAAGTLLACSEYWSAPGVDAGAFESATRDSPFPVAHTLVGRAFRIRGPVWIEDLDQDEDFMLREPAREVGLKSCVIFPARNQGEVLGVFEFYSGEKQPRDARLIATVTAIGQQLGQFFSWRRAALAARSPITDRERQVVQLTAEGMHVTQVAERLAVKPATVKSHFRNIYEKLEVSDRAGAVAESMRLGLVR